MSTGKLGAALLLILAMVVGVTTLARAETVDCTPIATLPAVLTVQGLYCLTANLSTAATTGNVIDVQAPNVVLDLNGFTLDGSGAGAGTQAVGIHALNQVNITIKNGTIRGFLRGIFLKDAGGSQGHLVENVRADRNTYVGLQVEGKGIVVRRSQSAGTGGTTFVANADATGILAAGAGPRVVENDVTDTTKQGAGTAVGIQFKATTVGGLAEDNRVTTADKGIEFLAGGTGKCRNNLIFNVTTPFVGCTDASNSAAPAITSANSVTVAPGVAMTPFLVQTTGSPTNTISRTGTLPSGVSFLDNGNNTATISGTPAAGTQTSSPYAWVITASNGVPPDATQNFSFNVVCPAINVSGTIPDLFLNQPMSTATFTQTGGNGTIAWSATGFPTGIAINGSSGDVTGTPTQAGSFPAVITATDAGGCTGTKNVTVLVKDPPQITSANSVTVAPGVAMTPFQVQTTGSPTNTISRTGTLPSGVNFLDNGNNTATISGTPAAGTQTSSPYAWVITASNGAPPDATQNFTFKVECPVINVSGTIPALTFNVAMSTVTFTQTGGNPAIAWSQTGLPTGVTINSSSGQVSGTPSVTGTFNVTITATDVGGCTGSKNQSVTVAPVATGDSYTGLVDNTQFVITGGTTGSPTTPFVGQTGKLTTNDLPSGGVTATAETKATSGGGSVTIAADGTFIYTPKANPTAARTTSDSFTYTVTSNTGGGAAVTSAPGTVNLALVGRVWYVLNNGAAGNGQSQSPFNTLAAAIAASTAGTTATDTDTIYVYQGDGATTNLATASVLKAFQRFIGQGVALVVNSNTLVGAGGFPLIGNTLTLANNVLVNGIDMSTTTNSALVGVSTTNLSVTVRNLTTSTGTALNLSGATHPTGTVTVTTVTTSGSGSGAVHVSLTNVDATVALNGGSLAGAGANTKAIDINGGTGPFTYAGTISNTGSTGTNGGGINVATKTGTSTVTLSGATITLNTGANTAFNMSGNSAGTTVNVTPAGGGNGLDITTTSGTGFNATGAGIVNVSGSNNTVTTPTGTAVNLSGVGGALTFLSVSSIGAGLVPGIIMTNTTGSFIVTGDGGGTNNGSGGTISGKTGTFITGGTPGVNLSNVQNVQLNYMNITGNNHTGVKGTTVNGFKLNRCIVSNNGDAGGASNDESGVDIAGLTGTAIAGANPTSITNCTFNENFEFQVQITNTSGTLTDLQMSGNTISSTGAGGTIGNLFNFLALGTANMTLNLTSGTFTGNAPATATGAQCDHSGTGGTMTCNISGATFTDNNVGPQASVASNGTIVFNFSSNTVTGTRSHGINLFADANPGTKSITGTISGNTVGTLGVADSGSEVGFPIRVQNEGAVVVTLLISGNTVQESAIGGINVNHGITNNTIALNGQQTSLTITNNTIRNMTNSRGLTVNNNSDSNGGEGTVCSNISGNSFANIAGQVGDGSVMRIGTAAGTTHKVTQASKPALAAANGVADAQVFQGGLGTPTYNQPACPTP